MCLYRALCGFGRQNLTANFCPGKAGNKPDFILFFAAV